MFTAASCKRLSLDSLAATDGQKSPVNRPFLPGPHVFQSGQLFNELTDAQHFRVMAGKLASFENHWNGPAVNGRHELIPVVDYSASLAISLAMFFKLFGHWSNVVLFAHGMLGTVMPSTSELLG